MEASLSDSDESVRIPRRKKSNTDVSDSHKTPRREHNRHRGTQLECVICKKAGMPERKYMFHSTKYCNGMRNKRPIKDGMGGPVGSRNHAVQQHKKSENKCRKYLKVLKNQNKILYSIAKNSGSRR